MNCRWCRGRQDGCLQCPTVPESEAELFQELMLRLSEGEAQCFIRTEGVEIRVPADRISFHEQAKPAAAVKTVPIAYCEHVFRYENSRRRKCTKCPAVQNFRIVPEDPRRPGVWMFEDVEQLVRRDAPNISLNHADESSRSLHSLNRRSEAGTRKQATRSRNQTNGKTGTRPSITRRKGKKA